MTEKPSQSEPNNSFHNLTPNERARHRRKAALGFLALILLLSLGIWFFWDPVKAYTTELYELVTDRELFRQRIESYGIWAPLVYMGFQIFQVLVSPIPGELVGTAGGYTFGWFPSLIYSTIGLSVGSGMNFAISRLLGKSFVERMVPPEYLAKIAVLMERQGIVTVFIFFTIPGFPKDYLCFFLGLTPMSWRIFLAVACVGRIPGTLMLSVQGALVFHEQYWTFALMAGLSLIFIVSVIIWREKIYQMLYRLESNRGPLEAKSSGDETVQNPVSGPKQANGNHADDAGPKSVTTPQSDSQAETESKTDSA